MDPLSTPRARVRSLTDHPRYRPALAPMDPAAAAAACRAAHPSSAGPTGRPAARPRPGWHTVITLLPRPEFL